MFDIVESLQGPSRAAVDSDDDTKGQGSSSADKQQPAGQPAGRFSLWGMATALAENVKKSTADIAASVKDTDWRAELETFGKGVADDSHEAQEIMHKGLSSLESFPRQATAHLPAGLGAGLEGFGEHISGGVDPTLVQQRINKRLSDVGTGLRGIGTSMFTGTRELLEHVTEAISSELDSIEGMAARNKPQHSRSGSRLSSSGSSAKYSRLEAEISAMQRNSSTYCDEPEDSADYRAWLDTFDLAARKPDIDGIIAENAFMAELQARIVPLIVQYNDFWTRYFYQLHKLQQKHAQRQKLAQRAQNTTEDEIAWDDDTPGPSPAASPQQPVKTERTPADKGVERVGARQSPPPPLPLVATVVSTAVAEGHDEKESGDVRASSIAAKGSEEHSDVETSTASEGSSGGAPWTVVTSPRKGSQDDEVTSQEKAAEPAASASPSKAGAESPSGDSAPAAVAVPPSVPAPGAVSSPARALAHDALAPKEEMPAPQQKEAGQPEPVAKASVAAPKKPPTPTADDDEDLEISDEEGLAAEGEGSEVDGDWGGDWE